MKKNIKQAKNPDAILCSDFHLREDTPICRTDDFWEAQWKKVDFVSELQKKHNCPVFHAGDLFHHWKPSPYLLSKTIEHLPDDFYTVYGNHDLPQHSIELKEKSGIYTLWQAKALKIFQQGHWNSLPDDISCEIKGKQVYVWHEFVYTGKELFPGAEGKARSIMEKYKQFDLIVTGDNHQSFVYPLDGRLLVNPGSLMRQEAGQIDFKPSVYLWFAEDNSVERVYLPIDENVVSREHIIKVEERDERIDAFISKLNDDIKTTLSFEENIKRFLAKNRMRKPVKDIINSVL
jgi:predicted phosphodiesterase